MHRSQENTALRAAQRKRHTKPSISRQRDLQTTPIGLRDVGPECRHHGACVGSRHGAPRRTRKAAARPITTHGAKTGCISVSRHAIDPGKVTSDGDNHRAWAGGGWRAARAIVKARGRFAADRAHIPDEDALATASRPIQHNRSTAGITETERGLQGREAVASASSSGTCGSLPRSGCVGFVTRRRRGTRGARHAHMAPGSYAPPGGSSAWVVPEIHPVFSRVGL